MAAGERRAWLTQIARIVAEQREGRSKEFVEHTERIANRQNSERG